MKEKKQKDKASKNAFFTLSLPSFLLTVFFTLFNLILGLVSGSGWYYAIAGYFFVFAILRFAIVFYKWVIRGKTEDKELTLHIVIGALFFLLLAALTLTVYLIIQSGRPKVLGVFPAIVSALFSLIKVLGAIKKLNKAYKKTNHLKTTIRNINLAETLVSLITLSVTLITTFGDGNLESPVFLVIVSILGLLILILGIRMIVEGIRGKILLKKSRIVLPEQV